MKKLSFILSILFHFIINGQYTGQVISSSSGAGNVNSLGEIEAIFGPIAERKVKSAALLADIQGSPYANDKFARATIFYKNDNSGIIFYRYNAYNEEIEIKQNSSSDGQIRSLANDKNISLVPEDGKSIQFSTFIDKKDKTQNGYLRVLTKGKNSLYERLNVKFTEGQKAQNSFVKATPAKFSKFTEYYLKIEGRNRIDEVELKNKKVLKLLPNSSREQLQFYLKSNKISIKNVTTLMEAIQYLNRQ